jgi:hypothetical protein
MVWEIMKCYPHCVWYIGTRARQSKGSSCLQRVCNSICNGVVQMSTSGSSDASALIPVPSFLFQGSIALGSICEAVLGPATDGKHLVHPFLIAGWCGLFTQVPSSFPLHFAHASFAAFNELHRRLRAKLRDQPRAVAGAAGSCWGPPCLARPCKARRD